MLTSALLSGGDRPQRNYFELFALTQAFAIDQQRLDRAYRDIQTQVHPDKYVRGSGAQQLQAAQWAALANEAYRTLKYPLPRARYLVRLHAVDPDAHPVPASFLMAQLELRESVQQARSARNLNTLNELNLALQSKIRSIVDKLTLQLDTDRDFVGAAQSAQVLQFLNKLAADIDDAIEAVEV